MAMFWLYLLYDDKGAVKMTTGCGTHLKSKRKVTTTPQIVVKAALQNVPAVFISFLAWQD